jgi:predicted HTH domain antitoxin
MSLLTAEYPEDLLRALRMSKEEFESEARFAMAAKLFELGKLTSGQAAQLVPMERVEFLKRLSEVGVAAIAWDPAEKREEFGNA